MPDRTAKLRLGGFVAAALTSLGGLIILYGGAPRLFTTQAVYTITFTEAPNVGVGTPVRKSGVRIGQVSNIDLDPETGQVKVTVQVDRKYLPRLTDEPTVYRGILSGDTSVDFMPQVSESGKLVPPSVEPYPPGSIIPGITPVNPTTLVRQASGVLPSAQESMARILNSMERFEQSVPRIERAFDEIALLARSGRELVPELRKTNEEVQKTLASADDPNDPEPAGIRTTLAEIRDFMRATKPLVEDIRRVVQANEADISGAIKGIRQTTDSVNAMLSPENRRGLDTIIKNMEVVSDDLGKAIRLVAILLDQGDKTLKELNARLAQSEATIRNLELATKPLAENSEQVTKNINVAAEQLAQTLTEVRETLRVLNRADGSLQKVISDPTLYHNLTEATATLSRTLLRAEQIAQDLQVFADKVARRPETIGVGGALRPSAGLKESPQAPSPSAPLPPIAPIPSYRPNVPANPGDLPPK